MDADKAARGKELYWLWPQLRGVPSSGCAGTQGETDGASQTLRQPSGCLATKPKAGLPKFEASDRQRVVMLAHLGNQAALGAEPLTPEQQITRTMTTLNWLCLSPRGSDAAGSIP